jgi:hypothetical protein
MKVGHFCCTLSITNMNPIIIGVSQILPPEGWTVSDMAEDKVVFCANGQRQATLSVTKFSEDLSEDQFQLLCDIAVKSAKRLVTDGYVEVEKPFRDGDIRGVFLYGGDKSNGRLFFGYLSLVQRELRNLFVEGADIAPEALAEDFKSLVKALKKR